MHDIELARETIQFMTDLALKAGTALNYHLSSLEGVHIFALLLRNFSDYDEDVIWFPLLKIQFVTWYLTLFNTYFKLWKSTLKLVGILIESRNSAPAVGSSGSFLLPVKQVTNARKCLLNVN